MSLFPVDYPAFVVHMSEELERIINISQYVIICRGQVYRNLMQSGFFDNVSGFRNHKKGAVFLGVIGAGLGGPLGWPALASSLLWGGVNHANGKKNDVLKLKEYKHITVNEEKGEAILFRKGYNMKRDSYHELQ